MIKDDELEILEEAVREWGDKQIGMLTEECGELLSAMNKFLRGRVSKEAVVEELADVMIMCDQMLIMLDAVDDGYKVRAEKIQRLQSRLEQYYD